MRLHANILILSLAYCHSTLSLVLPESRIEALEERSSNRKHQVGDDLKVILVVNDFSNRRKAEEDDSETIPVKIDSNLRPHHISMTPTSITSSSSNISSNTSSISHYSHYSPLKTLDESHILGTHDPTPLSYFEFDRNEPRLRKITLIHAVIMTISLLLLYPTVSYLKKSTRTSFLAKGALALFILLGSSLGVVYRNNTPNLYSGNVHWKFGWSSILLVFALQSIDVFRPVYHLLKRIWHRSFMRKRRQLGTNEESEISRLVQSPSPSIENGGNEEDFKVPFDFSRSVASNRHRRNDSDDTLNDDTSPPNLSPRTLSIRQKLVKFAFGVRSFLEGAVFLLSWTGLLTGFILYTGMARGNYRNGALAHFIKGSIFIWYGIISWCRYLGAFYESGWAWNRSESPLVSAEFVESFVMFLYGLVGKFTERIGKEGSPYSMKDYEHISIALMFFAGGILGMTIESKTIQTCFVDPTAPSSNTIRPFSLNPFPALVIFFTGHSMASHHQLYQFQIDVHSLWGHFLMTFAFFRVLTYTFLYSRPPTTIEPSRPPTEALASFCLVAAGIVFILSTEEIVFYAMRNALDDIGAVMNVTVSFTLLILVLVQYCLVLKISLLLDL